MPDIQLPGSFEGFRARLQAELDAQVGALAESHASEIEAARQAAAAEAEARWTATLEGTRAEWRAQLEQDVAAARAEAERNAAAALAETRAELERARAEAERTAVERGRAEAEQASAARLERQIEEAAERARSEAEQAAYERLMELQRERDQAVASIRAESDDLLRAERLRAEQELANAHAALETERKQTAELRAAQQAAAAMAPAPQAEGANLDADRLLDTIGAIDSARSISDVLALTAAAAASIAPRAALFVANGPQLEEWTVPDVPQLSSGTIRTIGPDAGILGEAMGTGRLQQVAAEGGQAPAFAPLASGRRAIAVPLTIGGEPVAVVYADDATEGGAAGWADEVQIVARHATACLAYLTAVRIAQAARLMAGEEQGARSTRASAADGEGARRYARLLVSEIKLYNEGAVRVGREKRDLQRRLKPEIDRARRLFEERIPASVPSRDACFQQELVQTLADGDASLLG